MRVVTFSYFVRNENAVAEATTKLVRSLCWFEVTPIPFNTWKITVQDFSGQAEFFGDLGRVVEHARP